MHSSNQMYLLSLTMTIIFTTVLSDYSVNPSLMYPFSCSAEITTCNSYLYHISTGLTQEEIASIYSVNTSQLKPITHGTRQDYLVSVPCSCTDVDGISGYFYETVYRVKYEATYEGVRDEFYSGQAWNVAGEEQPLSAGDLMNVHLLCGCAEEHSQVMVTYTVQEHDTLMQIAELLSANLSTVERLNWNLIKDPSFIVVGWVLFVPMEMNGTDRSQEAPIKGVASEHAKTGKGHRVPIIIGTASVAAVVLISMMIVFLLRRKKGIKIPDKDPDAIINIPRNFSRKDSFLQYKILHEQYTEDVESFESEQTVTYSVEEINDAANNFDESRKIGEGGYGSVYIGTLKEREVAIKKMKSSWSKEFNAELKVLCRIHHINVVELLGYASGDNHLYLVYEYISNGSLSDHLHDPLTKGHSPLSWTARLSIALDSARGIEYIHDHTKECYVHRDIKTSNILLDQGLRAKIADFGLAKLVERSNEQDLIATCLVGTPGYIAPESVLELQMTSKSDVFAFGVVLAELITGQPALIRDNQEPNKMKPLISVMRKIFLDEDREGALEASIDPNLRGIYPIEQVHKMADTSERCLSDEAAERPDMREVVQMLSQILTTSVEWEASSPGGNGEDFSWLLKGR